VLFSDLRGFTRYSEKISPERLVSELNAYLDVMVTVVRKHGGMVDKYIGDAIMVVFGLPEPQPDAPLRALRAAAEMQAALLVHNADRERRGLPPLQQGIGVHHGHAIAGNIGTEDRLQYTVIGDVVNLASRLESVTKERGVSSLFSQDVVDAAQATGQETPPLAAAGSVQARGRDGSIEVYTLR
jgi:adenylate cyclase